MGIQEALRTSKGEILYEESEILKRSENYKNRKFVFRKWDMYWAAVRFEDDPRYFKIRPVILCEMVDKNIINILWCTHVQGQNKYPIKNYMNLGLKEPTYIVKKPELMRISLLFEPLRNSLSKEDRKALILGGYI